MGRKFSTSTPRIYGLRHQCLALPELQSRLVFQPSSPHNSSSSRPSLLLPEIKWPLVPPAVIQDSNSGRGQEVSLETNAPLDVFRWPTMASSPTPVASEPSQQTSQQEPTPDTPDVSTVYDNARRPNTDKLCTSSCICFWPRLGRTISGQGWKATGRKQIS